MLLTAGGCTNIILHIPVLQVVKKKGQGFYATLGCTTLCCVVLLWSCQVMLCYGYVMSCSAMVMSCSAIYGHVMSCSAIAMSCHALFCQVMSCSALSCYVMLCCYLASYSCLTVPYQELDMFVGIVQCLINI